MKILMLTPYLPYPPSSGGQVRSYNLIKNLADRHQITLFSLIKSEEERRNIPELEKYCKKVRVFNRPARPWTLKNILKTAFSFYPFLVIRNLSSEEKKAVKKELEEEKYDLIHAETFYVMPHIPQTEIPILLVDQTIEFQVYQHYVKKIKNFFLKPFFYIDVWKIKSCEIKFWKKADKVVAVSEADKKKMLSLVPGLKVDVVPNGAGEDLMKVWESKKERKNPIIFFQANFSWLQNTEAAINLAKKVFPAIKDKIPQAQCKIVGQGAKEKIWNLQSSGVRVVDLPTSDTESVLGAYKQATVFVAPLEGPGGTRLKILGAMAAGVPVVTTKVGIEGIDALENKEVLIGQTWEELAEKTVNLLEDENLFERLVKSARKLVEKKYNYQKIALILDKIYRQLGNVKN